MKTLLVLGGSGLVGAQIVAQAVARTDVARVVAPTRRPLVARDKLESPIVDFAHLPDDAPFWRADAALCALGTTRRQAGSAEAFERIDRDYVIDAAKRARGAGTEVFVYNSSVGADAGSSSLYLRSKGQTEEALAALGFRSLTIVRPSLLDGGPRPESRPGEAVGLAFARVLRPVIPRRWRAVTTAAVARCMLDAALAGAPGDRFVESEAIDPGA
jgi:uncharacterized protein YbjT (DUF2867 family)